MGIKRIMVVGAGQMGSGIAQVAAQAGIDVVLNDHHKEALDRGLKTIDKFLSKNVEKNRMTTEDKEGILRKITQSTSLDDARDVDLVIEAVVENIDIKRNVFQTLDQTTPKETILASNTSSLPITEIAAATNRPEQVIGMHFMNPVPVMQLVEIIRGIQTNDETYMAIDRLVKQLQKTPVEAKDFPGFAANRILMPMINEAVYTLYEGIASKEDIDTVMKLGMNHPMVPLTLADFIGLDTCLYIMEVLYEGFGDSKYRPCPLLRQYVQAGWLGKKAGRGFYIYD